MIEIKNVSKSYIRGQKVIDNINLEIKNGEILGFIGPNGAGKTTIIKMMTGILDIDEGDILIDGVSTKQLTRENIHDLFIMVLQDTWLFSGSVRENIKFNKDDVDILIDGKSIKEQPYEAKKEIGLIPDSPDMFLNLKGIQYLNFMADIYRVSEEDRKKIIKDLSKTFEIEDALNEKIESYSHGMRQKIVIIGTLLHSPKNWILDEPITGLDPKAIYDLKIMMREYAKKGNVVFFSTHILEVAENLCDRVVIINKGKIIFIGKIEELKQKMKENNSLEELFMEIISDD